MVLLDTRWDADGDTTKLMLEALLGFLSSVSPAIRELLTRLKLLRAMVKLPPGWESGPSYCRHQHAQCCAHNKVHYPGWREEKRLEALTSARSNSFSHAAKGPWKGFKMTLCAIFGQNSHCCETLSSFTEYSLRTLPGDRSDYKMKLPRKATWRFTQFQRHLSQESRWQSYPRVYQNKHL